MNSPETTGRVTLAASAGPPLRTIAVIDDSDADLVYAQVVLNHAKVAEHVLTFGSGIEALHHLRSASEPAIEVILLDINMPEMDGFEFLAAYERLDARLRARAVIVMLSSSPHPDDRARAQSHPSVRGYLVKPLRLEAIRSLPELLRRSA